MTHDELVEKVARDLAILNDDTEETWEDYHAEAQTAISTILAALQEPTPKMRTEFVRESVDQGCIDGPCEIKVWKAMLAASPLASTTLREKGEKK